MQDMTFRGSGESLEKKQKKQKKSNVKQLLAWTWTLSEITSRGIQNSLQSVNRISASTSGESRLLLQLWCDRQ